MEEMKSTKKNEIIRGKEKYKIEKRIVDDSCYWTARGSAVLASGCST